MKLWWTKFRISAALDSGKPIPESLRHKIAADPELEHFTRHAEALARQLRKPQPTDSSMHDGIMRAVRTSARRKERQPASTLAWLAPIAAVATVAAISLWIIRPHPAQPSTSSLDGPITILEMSEKMPSTMPSAMMAPLTNEWAKVDHDVRKTTQILASCFPF